MKHFGKFPGLACALGLLFGACQSTPQGRADGQTTPQAPDEKIAKLEQRIADLDQRLQTIELVIRAATNEDVEPDPSAVYSVPIDGLPYVGPKYAKVTLVQAYEFACPYCSKVPPILQELLTRYRGDLKVVYAPFIVHADVAVPPALAVCAAHAQGKFSEMETLIWQKAWATRDLSIEKMDALAREAGLDMKRYVLDTASDQCRDTIRKSVANLSRVGTTGTPTFYINGRFLIGAQPIETFAAVIDEELAKANQAVAKGIPVAEYYQKAVVEGGKTSP